MITAALEASRRPIGTNGLLISAHALALNATLATATTHEFSRGPGLRYEN